MLSKERIAEILEESKDRFAEIEKKMQRELDRLKIPTTARVNKPRASRQNALPEAESNNKGGRGSAVKKSKK